MVNVADEHLGSAGCLGVTCPKVTNTIKEFIMTARDHELARGIRITFGTATTEPSSIQLGKIKQEIQALHARGVTPSESDWAAIVRKYCPAAGSYSYLYEGAEASDLNSLLELATKK